MAQAIYHAFTGREYETGGKKKTFWTRIGSVFPHKNGKGMDLVLDALPVDGRVTLFEPREKPEAPPADAE